MSAEHPRPQLRAEFRFYEELNDFLPPARRKRDFTYAFHGRPAVKDAIEALGVPHPEVDLILVNGESVGFGHPLRDGDRVSVYPVFESLEIAGVTRLRPRPLREPRFILDVHLGRRVPITNYDYELRSRLRITITNHEHGEGGERATRVRAARRAAWSAAIDSIPGGGERGDEVAVGAVAAVVGLAGGGAQGSAPSARATRPR